MSVDDNFSEETLKSVDNALQTGKIRARMRTAKRPRVIGAINTSAGSAAIPGLGELSPLTSNYSASLLLNTIQGVLMRGQA